MLLCTACTGELTLLGGSSGGLSSSSGGSGGSTSSSSSGGSSSSGSSSSGSSSGSSGSSSSGGSSSSSSGSSSSGSSGSELVCPQTPMSGAYAVDDGGVTFTLSSGRLRVQVCKDDILRVQYTTAASIPAKTSLSISNAWGKTRFCVAESNGAVTLTTLRVKARVDTGTGLVSFTDTSDNPIVSEAGKSLTPVNVEGVQTSRVETVFNSPRDEGLFGLGQHQDGVMNRKGTDEHIENGNGWVNVPVLVSSRGYGIFWDNYSKSDFYGNEAGGTRFKYVSEVGDQVDYYLFYGPSIDQVVARYRTATGAAPLFPKWAYGLFHSKDKYESQSELLAVKDGYRNNNIPLDCVVQDWEYWKPYAWGSHLMNETRYPDPGALMSQLHGANVHGMISIWPVYQTHAELKAGEMDNYKALDQLHALFWSDADHHFYDVFNGTARGLVFQQIQDRLLGKYGWDGIWADNTEPQGFPNKVNIPAADTALGKGVFYLNAYPLQHSKALYEGWRSVGPKQKRAYVLTRSAFAGQQRYATTVWSGDINCDFETMTRQIPAGLNFALAGMPYWTTDIGGYWGHPGRIDWTTPASNELFTRWFQYGTFCPIFRIHGGGSRELYGNQWSAATKATLLKFDTLRYRLMPYIYSLGWKVTSEGYTIMRHLVFDYQADPKVFNIKDQFLFGPAFLVNPVIGAGATSRSVYLPAGTWFDFWTGATVAGGSTTNASAPLSQIPLYVKAGSVVPMGPVIQYATQSIDPLEIRVYPGRDGTFTLYEDAGDAYDYESGQSAQITLTWSEAAQALTIGARKGSYPGMPQSRTFNVVWVGASHGAGVDVTASPDRVVQYTGAEAVVKK